MDEDVEATNFFEDSLYEDALVRAEVAEARAAELEAALAADRAAAHAPGGGVRHLESIMDLQNDLHQRLALEFSVARIGRVSCLAIVAILDVALARAAELEAALAAERAAHQWRPFHVNGDHPIGVPIEAIVVVEDDNDNLTWGFDVRFWRPAAPQEPTP